MEKEELIEYAIRTSNAIKEEFKQELIDYYYEQLTQLKKQKEIIDKTIKAIKEMLYGNFKISETEYLMVQNENTAFGVRAIELLKILEDKGE